MRALRYVGMFVLLVLSMMLLTGTSLAASSLPQEAPPVAAPDYTAAAIGGVPLVFVIWGIVQIAKSNGAKGLTLRWVAMAAGAVLGVLYLLYSTGIPVSWQGWVFIVIYALGLGIVSWGSNDAAREIVAQGTRQANGGP